jgi:microcystin-dependent protein
MAQPFVGQIISVGFSFAPVGWQMCDGTLLPISEYEALYSLLGTTYGGNGTSTFAVPDLRGRAPLCMGQGSGLPNYIQGQIAGSESVTLIANQVGAHSHSLLASTKNGSATNPASGLALGQNPVSTVPVYGPSSTNVALAGSSIGNSVGGVPHENRQPYLTINYIISLFGVYPSQS